MVKLIVRATIWDQFRDRFRLTSPRWQLAIVCGFIFCVLIVFSCIGTGIRRILQGGQEGRYSKQTRKSPWTIQPYQFGERAQQDAIQAVRKMEGQRAKIEHTPKKFKENWLDQDDQIIRKRNRERQENEPKVKR